MASTSDREQFETQLEVLRNLAARSTSPAVTSRWIAASDDRIKELIFKKLDEGLQLRSVTSHPRSRSLYVVLFSFERQAAAVTLVPTAFVVTVDFLAKQITDVRDPYLGDEAEVAGGSLPFAMKIPSNAHNVVVSREAGAPHRAAEREFFGSRGITPDPLGPVLPERPGRPGGFFPERPGLDFPQRGSWIPSPAAGTYIKVMTQVATDVGTDTITGNPPQTEDVENDGYADNETDTVPYD